MIDANAIGDQALGARVYFAERTQLFLLSADRFPGNRTYETTIWCNGGTLDQLRGRVDEATLRRLKIPFDMEASTIWRYTSVDKLVSLLVTGTAYFRRLDLLEDQFESHLSPLGHKATVADLEREAADRKLLPEGVDPYDAAYLSVGSSIDQLRASVFVNCWHRNEHESWAMWKIFGLTGVAIRSTVGRIRDAFIRQGSEGERVYAGMGAVEYIDHMVDEMAHYLPWLYKNHMFSWEQEIRMFTMKVPAEYNIAGFNEDHPGGLFVPANIDVLIESVVVAPGSDEQFREKVHMLLAEAELPHKEVFSSAADTMPDYVQIHKKNQQVLLELGKTIPKHSRLGDG